jgi:hypothetical protein
VSSSEGLPFPLNLPDISRVGEMALPNMKATEPVQPKRKVTPVDLSSVRTSMDRLKKGGGHSVGKGAPSRIDPATKSGPAQASGFVLASGDMYDAIAGSGGAALSALRSGMEPTAYLTEQKQASGPAIPKAEPAEEQAQSQPVATESTIDCAPDVIAPPRSEREIEEDPTFSARRTEALPLVTIDIERLLQATFTATQFGKLALNNQALDQHLRQTLLDVDTGKSLQLVISSSVRTPASVLSTYRFCLARGYVISSDPVIPLTADLLLGRIELDQYLLQRRRINGDELRDLIEIQRQKGVKLADLLVRSGYLTQSDLERLTAEQKRFALK